MTRFCTLLILLFSVSLLNAQQRFYIFIQTEDPGTFYIKKDNKVQSASSGGYLIISNLPDGKHEFSIGFSNSTLPEQHFSIDLKGKDRSYLLKNFDNKGWGLFDMQDLSIAYAQKAEPGFKLKPAEDVSPFTNVLVQASGDSTLKYTAVVSTKAVPVINQKSGPVNITQPVEKNDQAKLDKPVQESTTNQDEKINYETQKPQPLVDSQVEQKVAQKLDTLASVTFQKVEKSTDEKNEEGSAKNMETIKEYQHSKIIKVSEGTTTDGLGIVYRDISPDGKVDTVKILIDDKEEKPVQVVASQAKPSKEIKFLDISTAKDTSSSIKTESLKVEKGKAIQSVESDRKAILNNCSDQVSDKELARLRSKMALAVTDENMITEAENVFEKKCMTSSQVKRLSELFVTNAGKYSFFKAVYPYVADKQYFYTLRSELTDDHYNSRFGDIMQSR